MVFNSTVNISRGDTVDIRVNIIPENEIAFDGDDLAIVALRDIQDSEVWSLQQNIQNDERGYYILWTMSHFETEPLLGVYRWGIAIYQNATFSGDYIDGDAVAHPVVSALFVVEEPIARENNE